MSDPFELFWSAYPRKVAKGKAREAFTKALRLTTLNEMLTALEWQREQPQWQRQEHGELSFVPHPATYLHQERWSDEAPKQRTTAAIITFMASACADCCDGWREDERGRVVRCSCRTAKVRTA